MKKTKIHLSPTEMDLMCNASIILTKNKILHQVKLLLEELQAEMLETNFEYDTNNIFAIPPKISKGENYLGLPYLVLDYPRIFTQSNTFAIRTMFWWGHFFSSTLHLAGQYATTFRNKIENQYQLLSSRDYFIGIQADPWQHHFEETNYKKISTMPEIQFQEHCSQDHIKIAAKWPLMDWPVAANHLFISWKMFLQLCFETNSKKY
ncbi:hypothetical protein OCK74_01875 [Chitinophagaceae bacterium LB-8]|uniref:Uncharacterized protein n=1 Tax=Paraflavisolibacter caeni TaxID=2982496 RepID=A0A9X3BGM0_9BACT|nr:hypothetical protein [Paraflavisolibacter caeni]MCU7547838.1 hypothetical protein [Paraflavisolibacter caeni]